MWDHLKVLDKDPNPHSHIKDDEKRDNPSANSSHPRDPRGLRKNESNHDDGHNCLIDDKVLRNTLNDNTELQDFNTVNAKEQADDVGNRHRF